MLKLPTFLGGKKPASKIDLAVLFHKECNGHIEHGTIYADHRMQNLKNEPIRFAFQNVDAAPEMTPELLAHVWEAAEAKGYIVHNLRSYATVLTLMVAPQLHAQAPSRRPGQTGIATTARKRADQPNRASGTRVVS